MATAEQQQPTPSRATVLDSVRAQLRGELGLIEHELPESEQLDLLPAADSVRLMPGQKGIEPGQHRFDRRVEQGAPGHQQ